jgi:hypothetical protein
MGSARLVGGSGPLKTDRLFSFGMLLIRTKSNQLRYGWAKAFPLVATVRAPHPFLRGHPATPPRLSSLRDSLPVCHAAHRLLAPADNSWVAALRLTLHSSPALVPRSGTSVALPAAFSSPMAFPLARSWPTTAITVLVISCRIVAPLLALVLTIFDVTTAQLRSRLPRLWYDGTQEHAMSMIRFQGVGVVG